MNRPRHSILLKTAALGTLLVGGSLSLAALRDAGIGGAAHRGAEFDLTRYTIDGGGIMRSTGGGFELSATTGQPDTGVLTAGPFELSGGFWFALTPTDCNEDGGVNLFDYSAFESCLTGPAAGVATGCECFDVDRSGTVDLRDFTIAQTAFTGS